MKDEYGKPTLGRCVALDQDGKRCRKQATGYVRYHGENELTAFSERASWVAAAFCEPHTKPWIDGSPFRTSDAHD